MLLFSLFLFWWVFMLHIYRQQSYSISVCILINLEVKILQFPILKMFPSLPVSWKSCFLTQLLFFFLTYGQFILVDVSRRSWLKEGIIYYLNKKILLPFSWVPLVDASAGLIDIIPFLLLLFCYCQLMTTLWFIVLPNYIAEIFLFPAYDWISDWISSV